MLSIHRFCRPMVTLMPPRALYQVRSNTNFTGSVRTLNRQCAMPKRCSSRLAKAERLTDNTGKLVVTGCAGAGFASLVLYGVLQQPDDSVANQAMMWPQYVHERIAGAYLQCAYGLGVTASTAYMIARNSARFSKLMTAMCTIPGALASMAAVMCSGICVQMINYNENKFLKQLAWTSHAGLLGVFLFPIVTIGGPIVAEAAMWTGGILAGLSAIAAVAPSDKFLYIGGPLGIAFGALFFGNIASIFMVKSAAFPLMNSVLMYGGLVVFSGFILNYTHSMVHRAKVLPPPRDGRYDPNWDPINSAIGLYTSTLNLFITIVNMLMSSNRRK